MKYVIIGAGGTGGILGFYMTKAGKDVTLIARNAHLAAMKEQGLTVRHLWDGTTETVPVKAENMETYESMIASAGEAAKPAHPERGEKQGGRNGPHPPAVQR